MKDDTVRLITFGLGGHMMYLQGKDPSITSTIEGDSRPDQFLEDVQAGKYSDLDFGQEVPCVDLRSLAEMRPGVVYGFPLVDVRLQDGQEDRFKDVPASELMIGALSMTGYGQHLQEGLRPGSRSLDKVSVAEYVRTARAAGATTGVFHIEVNGFMWVTDPLPPLTLPAPLPEDPDEVKTDGKARIWIGLTPEGVEKAKRVIPSALRVWNEILQKKPLKVDMIGHGEVLNVPEAPIKVLEFRPHKPPMGIPERIFFSDSLIFPFAQLSNGMQIRVYQKKEILVLTREGTPIAAVMGFRVKNFDNVKEVPCENTSQSA